MCKNTSLVTRLVTNHWLVTMSLPSEQNKVRSKISILHFFEHIFFDLLG